MEKLLDHINTPEDLRKLSPSQLPRVADELREFIIRVIANHPGHLGASLGTVELTVALHYIFNTPYDRIIWDVGHQAYGHKILTGRKGRFASIRCMDGLSGFPARFESEYDAFGTGHSSTSISAALGMAIASNLKGEKDRQHIAVIGDGAMTGGLAFEGMNNAGADPDNDILIILNDNRISIDPNVGALKETLLDISTSRHYNRFKDSTWKALNRAPRLRRVIQKMLNGAKSFFLHQSNLFESFNFRYFGPVDGNDVVALVKALRDLRNLPGPKILHALTVKGKGYAPAEQNQTQWHAPGRFDPDTGERLAVSPEKSGRLRYQDIFGHTLVQLAEADPRIVGITPAMPTGCSMNLLMERMPDRAYDVGIAEGHAVTFAAGLAVNGKRPFISVYSSFLQRAYDQINHDVARMKLPVVIGIDRCGLVGEDGETHHGVFDITMLHAIPNLIMAQPKDAKEARALMKAAFAANQPFCIRYPRGSIPYVSEDVEAALPGTWTRWTPEKALRACVISYGSDIDRIVSKVKANDMPVEIINARYFKPLDEAMLDDILYRSIPVIVYESDMLDGGLSSAILQYINDHRICCHLIRIGIGDHYVEQGSIPQLRRAEKIDMNTLFKELEELCA